MEHARAAGGRIKTHLTFAVVSTVFLCLPLGIAAVICASRTSALLMEGDRERAQKCSRAAFALCVASAVAGFASLAFAVWMYYFR